ARQEVPDAEVSVGQPQVAFLDLGDDLVQQGAFLSVAVLTADDVGDESASGFEYGQGLPRQRGSGGVSGLGQAVLGAGEVVAIEDAHAVARNTLGVETTDLLDERAEPLGGLLHQEG